MGYSVGFVIGVAIYQEFINIIGISIRSGMHFLSTSLSVGRGWCKSLQRPAVGRKGMVSSAVSSEYDPSLRRARKALAPAVSKGTRTVSL